MNHGQIEVPQLLQVQGEGGRGLGAAGGVEGLGRENLRGRVSLRICLLWLLLVLFISLELSSGVPEIAP